MRPNVLAMLCWGVAALAMVGPVTAGTVRPAAVTYTFVDLGGGPSFGLGNAWAYGRSKTITLGTFADRRISCGKACSSTLYHAVAWTGSPPAPVDITPAQDAEGFVNAAAGPVAAGSVVTIVGGYLGSPHAMVWTLPGLQAYDINPPADQYSYAYGTDGRSVAGSGGSNGEHALLWSGIHAQPVDLHPAAFTSSVAYAVAGGRQAGAALTSTGLAHAIAWHGSAASAVDITPAGFASAIGYAIDSRDIAGDGVPSGTSASHALLWHAARPHAIDLQPAGFIDSVAQAVHSGMEAGYGHDASHNEHALVWFGNAASVVDLEQFLTASYTQSIAYGFDAQGDVLGAAYADDPQHGLLGWHAIVWTPG